MVELSAREKQKYLSCGGSRCPKCLAFEIEGGALEMSSGEVTQEVLCRACGLQYKDVYTLTDVDTTPVTGLEVDEFEEEG